ncbi:hypothetical protein BDZ89DRAFT_922475, partial [Hymenopellis radicata]
MTEAFAKATSQDFGIYYAEDCAGRGKKRIELTGRNAEAAWSTPIKGSASDLSGRLPLVLGMPILLVDNLAVELGLCNGSYGKLISINYTVKHGRRYAISAEADFPRYRNPDRTALHPHRALIPVRRKP